jgi:Helix-turn-helix domain
VSPRDLDPPKRHTGELYDAIWELDVPTIPNKPTEKNPSPTGVAVGPSTVRLVLMAMAKHTNPHRDKGQWRCCPTVERLSTLANVSDRQVQRVLEVFVDLGYIEIERWGLRAGRGRAARPTWWRLRPDLWPARQLNGNGGVAHVVTIADSEMVATHAPIVASPATALVNGRVAGDGEMAMVASPASPKPGTPVKPGTPELNPEKEPALARSRSGEETIFSLKTDDRTNGHQVALPLTSAVGLATPPGAGTAAAAPLVDALPQGKRLWDAARQRLLRTGSGVDPSLEARVRNTGTVAYNGADGVLTLEGDLVAEDLEPGSVVVEAVVAAARGRELELRLLGISPSSRLTLRTEGASSQTSNARAESIDGEAAATVRARLAEKLSADELARLDELERQRVAYAALEAVPAADDRTELPQTELPGTGAADREGVERKSVDEAPRRRRKKEPAVA